jgi:hypothetical protein
MIFPLPRQRLKHVLVISIVVGLYIVAPTLREMQGTLTRSTIVGWERQLAFFMVYRMTYDHPIKQIACREVRAICS